MWAKSYIKMAVTSRIVDTLAMSEPFWHTEDIVQKKLLQPNKAKDKCCHDQYVYK